MRVGIVGGGQLGRMLALAGAPLDIRCTTLDPAADSPASYVAPSIVGRYDDREALARLADGSDVVTYEFENVPVAAARFLSELAPVYPPPEALESAQDRATEKALFDEVGLPTAPHEAVATLDELQAALGRIGTPAVLKSRRLGYDGKGQAVIHDAVLAEDAWRGIGEVPSLVEGFVDFQRELSIVGVRARDGSTAFYPLIENHHREGILRRSVAPAPRLSADLQAIAERHARAVMHRLGYVGVLAIELFQVGEELRGNELAPRVHNSGHWTIEGADTSQFENHLRAVTGLPLGSTAARGVSVMLNLIGEVPDPSAVAAIRGAHLHLYAKEPRPRRKLGHVTVTGEDLAGLPLDELRAIGLGGT
ncbi:MAG: 5-(carboxyamino)imidazole ribonucleotide synthase [Actinomycetota bacterium]